jgi:hypothetical protein
LWVDHRLGEGCGILCRLWRLGFLYWFGDRFELLIPVFVRRLIAKGLGASGCGCDLLWGGLSGLEGVGRLFRFGLYAGLVLLQLAWRIDAWAGERSVRVLLLVQCGNRFRLWGLVLAVGV